MDDKQTQNIVSQLSNPQLFALLVMSVKRHPTPGVVQRLIPTDTLRGMSLGKLLDAIVTDPSVEAVCANEVTRRATEAGCSVMQFIIDASGRH